MIKTILQTALVFLSLLIFNNAYSQNVQIELGPDEIGLNETFTIKVTLSNDKIKRLRKQHFYIKVQCCS